VEGALFAFMSGAGEGAGGQREPLPPSAFLEQAAEESGDEGGDSEEDENKPDDGRDLVGFIASNAEVARERRGGDADSASSDAVEDEQELIEEDLAVLEEAGVDASQLRKRARGTGEADEEPASQRLRLSAADGDDLAAQLFGAEGDEAPGRTKPANADAWEGLSEGESVDDFIVEDDGSARRRRLQEAQEFDISEEQLREIIDIFGDTTVLRPIDEIGGQETMEVEMKEGDAPEAPLATVTAVQKDDSISTSTAFVIPRVDKKVELTKVEIQMEDMDQDPDRKEKEYQTSRDFELEVMDAPERWVQLYHAEPELLDKEGTRRWSDEEHECEAKWIYMEAFWVKPSSEWGDQWYNSQWYEQEATEAAVKRILELLHMHKLEPMYIVSQYAWQYLKLLKMEDFWTIFELDRQWQGLWAMYHRLIEWINNIDSSQLPTHIVEKANRRIWESQGAEVVLRDLLDWFAVMYPQEVAKETSAMKMAAVRQSKFDEKLGVTESVDEMTLKVFGITPQDLGTNVENNKQIYAPDKDSDQDDRLGVREVCEQHVNQLFEKHEAVLEAITLYLSRLIATEPRIRKFVRTQFWKLCCISTTPTDSGKPVAYDAAQSFKPSFRAFHLVNRPVATFLANKEDSKYKDEGKRGETLFLDVMELQRQGFLNLEYSLVVPETKAAMSIENAYKYVMLGHDEQDLVKDRLRMVEHDNKLQSEGDYVPNTEEELFKWNWCEQMRPRLEAVAKAHEIELRRKAVAQSGSLERASVLFKCAKMGFGSNHLNQFMAADPIVESLRKLYCKVEASGSSGEVFVVPSDWNSLRKRILLRALRDELYPMLWAEVQKRLMKEAEAEVCRQCCESLTKIVDCQPFRLSKEELHQQKEEDKWKYGGDVNDDARDSGSESDDDPEWEREKKERLAGYSSVLVVTYEVKSNTCVVSLVSPFGDPIDMRVLFKDFYKTFQREFDDPQSYEAMREAKRIEHQNVFKLLLKRYKPSVILLPVVDKETEMCKKKLQELIDDAELNQHFKVKPSIQYGNPSVPRVVAYHPRIKEEGVYRDCEQPIQRIAISSARFIQDPLAETAQLWHENGDENGLLKLRLHRLQHAVPKDALVRALRIPMMETLAKVGLHVNRVRRSIHLNSLTAFVPGFGPRKARMFRRCLSDAVLSRRDLAERIGAHLQRPVNEDVMKSSVVTNALPFIRIFPDPRDAWDYDTVPGLDRTRLGEPFRSWMMSLIKEALQHMNIPLAEEAEDARDARRSGAPIVKDNLMIAIQKQRRDKSIEMVLNEVDLNDWQHLAGVKDSELPDGGVDLDVLLGTHLMPEVLEPYKDNRQDFQELEDRQAFYLIIGETEETFNIGTVVHAVVRKDMEYPNPDGSGGGSSNVSVNLVPSMIGGSFRKMYKVNMAEQGYIPNCKRQFLQGETILARVVNISANPGRPYMVMLSVDMDADLWEKNFPLNEVDATYFVPYDSENWTKVKLGLQDASETQRKEKLKDWVRRPRNIRHTNWTDADHSRAVKIIDEVPLGNVLFRPSRRHDVLIAMLKVRQTRGENHHPVEPEKCFRAFEVHEKNTKTIAAAFEIASELEVDGICYKDMDEIIARHMDPIMENLRLFQEHGKFGLRSGEVVDRFQLKDAIKRFSKEDRRMLWYVLTYSDMPGHGTLIWTLGGQKPREELIEIAPEGYALWGQNFDTVKALIHWFKTIGWRNSSRCRSDWREGWNKRHQEAKDKRGEDAIGDKPAKPFVGWAPDTVATRAGLQTPTAAAGTPTFYAPEAAAPTPCGLVPGTPGLMGGYKTPDASNPMSPAPMAFGRVPGTPAELRGGVPGTPSQGQGFAPRTPFGLAVQPQRHMPMTPGGGFAPMTPAGLQAGPQVHRRGVPTTPAGYGSHGMPMTPGGPPPLTPGGPPPMTPGGIPPMTPGGVLPMTPGGLPPMTPGGPPPMTPGGPPPMTPGGPPPMTPGGLQPVQTFAPVTPSTGPRLAGAPMMPAGPPPGTPGGPPPMTPSGPVPRTPGAK